MTPRPRPDPRLTDRAALDRFRRRATDTFLHRLARDEVQDRLALVNRSFTDIAVVTPDPPTWSAAFPGALCVADDDVLRLEPGAHDLVIHAMALHWSDDPVGQLVQCRLALRPDGMLLAIAPAGDSLTELRAALARAEAETCGGLSPRVLPMGDIRDLGALLQRAGLAMPVADTTRLTLTYRDLWHLMHDLRAWGEVNALVDRPRVPTRRALFDRAAGHYRDACAGPDGRLPATIDLITLTGWAPSPDQPQPLRPGSASHRLAGALGTSETRLPD